MRVNLKPFYTLFTFCLMSHLTACDSNDSGAGPTNDSDRNAAKRSYYMGFTPWSYDATQAAVNDTYRKIQDNGDIVAHHMMQGIPWNAAFNKTAYHPNVESEISARIAQTQSDKIVFLDIGSLDMTRQGLALNWGENENEARPIPWHDRSFNDPEVITAYSNFAIDLIHRFGADYFNYSTEISELILHDINEYNKFVVFAEQVYSNIKQVYPDLPLLVSIAFKSPNSAEMNTIAAEFSKIAGFVDIVGISLYPYAFYNHENKGNPNNLSEDWINQISRIAGNKPVAVTETGWIAEDISIDAFGLNESSNPDFQNRYTELLLSQANSMKCEFIIWFAMVDFDALWSNHLGQDDAAAIWRDTGLYDEMLQPRPALQTWQNFYARERE